MTKALQWQSDANLYSSTAHCTPPDVTASTAISGPATRLPFASP